MKNDVTTLRRTWFAVINFEGSANYRPPNLNATARRCWHIPTNQSARANGGSVHTLAGDSATHPYADFFTFHISPQVTWLVDAFGFTEGRVMVQVWWLFFSPPILRIIHRLYEYTPSFQVWEVKQIWNCFKTAFFLIARREQLNWFQKAVEDYEITTQCCTGCFCLHQPDILLHWPYLGYDPYYSLSELKLNEPLAWLPN